MAIAAALLVTLVCGSVLAAATLVAGLERRTAAAYAVTAALRQAALGGLAAAAGELDLRSWDPVLAGAGSQLWAGGVAPSTDAVALGSALERETMSMTAHGADTPVWRVFAAAPWSGFGAPSSAVDLIVWVADDWQERDGNPAADTNGLLLVRVAAVQGVAHAWAEGLFRRDTDGAMRGVYTRVW